jgi:hypothetical protein
MRFIIVRVSDCAQFSLNAVLDDMIASGRPTMSQVERFESLQSAAAKHQLLSN